MSGKSTFVIEMRDARYPQCVTCFYISDRYTEDMLKADRILLTNNYFDSKRFNTTEDAESYRLKLPESIRDHFFVTSHLEMDS